MKRPHVVVLLFALGVALAFSFRWMYPLYLEHESHGALRHNPTATWDGDSYFYYAKIKRIVDLKFDFDPIIYENRHRVDAYQSYEFSFLLAALGGILTGSTDHAFYFNNFVFPAVNFLLIFLFLFTVTRRRSLSLLFALFSMVAGMFFVATSWAFHYGVPRGWHLLLRIYHALDQNPPDLLAVVQLQRLPAMLVTNTQLVLFVTLLFLALEKNRTERRNGIALALALGVSSCTSTVNFVVCYLIFATAVLAARLAAGTRKFFAGVLAGALVVSLPGIWFHVQGMRNFSGVENYAGPDSPVVSIGLDVFYLILPLAVLAPFKTPHRKFLLSVLVGNVLAYLIIQLVFGHSYSGRVVTRGTDVLIGMITWAGIGAIYELWLARKPLSYHRATANIAMGLAVLSLCLLLANQYRQRKNFSVVGTRDFHELCDWTQRFAHSAAVGVALDLDVLEYLPACGSLYLYLPSALLSSTKDAERMTRLYETARYFGVTQETFRKTVGALLPCWTTPHNADELARKRLNTILFYFRYYNTTPAANLADKWQREYAGVAAGPSQFTHRADYLIVSATDSTYWLSAGSAASRLIATERPVFANATYRIYALPGK